MTGVKAGHVLHKFFGRKVEILGGLILIAIGIRILGQSFTSRIKESITEKNCQKRGYLPPAFCCFPADHTQRG
ncbi:MAG: manganese efflux pump [Candidatus Marinimicrobia bacterium]|nr:manganese efflux pump [Candidatus Neomarinimicrobiota bacterium]